MEDNERQTREKEKRESELKVFFLIFILIN